MVGVIDDLRYRFSFRREGWVRRAVDGWDVRVF